MPHMIDRPTSITIKVVACPAFIQQIIKFTLSTRNYRLKSLLLFKYLPFNVISSFRLVIYLIFDIIIYIRN